MTVATVNSEENIEVSLERNQGESHIEFHKRVTAAVREELGLSADAELHVMVTIS